MAGNTSDFEALKLEAAREFAQTMIIIDDEASQQQDPELPEKTQTPTRKTRSDARDDEPSAEQGQSENGPGKLPLDAKLLIENAMSSGLICSVLRPKEGDDFQDQVVNAAQVADIVCLDWEIHSDSGNTALEIIEAIIQKDAEQNGRLRLIAIYTGKKESDDIMGDIFDAIPEKLRKNHKFKKNPLEIESSNGMRIVYLFKKNGINLSGPQEANQVSEDQLPKRLQIEFAKLSEGLLSNVALATIASIRTSTHHVLSKFRGQLDGPFFHHCALIGSPEDAEKYAVDIVLSELKDAVDKHQVAVNYAGPEAIERRIREMADSDENLTLHYEKEGQPLPFKLKVDYAIKIIKDGLIPSLEEGKRPPNSPGRGQFEKNLSTLFSDSRETAHQLMHEFAVLNCVCSYPGSHLYKSGLLLPKLGLGSIIKCGDGTYLMCLQASCDSVRIQGERAFLFVPLDEQECKPEYVVPILTEVDESKFTGLGTSSESYCKARSIVFLPCPNTKTVNAEKINETHFHFVDKEGNAYRWLADLKHKRALRTVQRLGQQMGRIGIDEFEPYRRKEQRF